MDTLQTVKNYEFGVGLDPENYEYTLLNGRGRYNKVIAEDFNKTSRRAVAFQDKQTGHIFKAGSWSQPARTRIA